MKKKTAMLSVVCVLTLPGCSTYFAKVDAQNEIKSLCALDGGVRVFRAISLPPSYFKDGSLKYDRREKGVYDAPLTVASRYEIRTTSKNIRTLPDKLLEVTRYDTTVVDSFTKETLATSRTYCRSGGDTLALNRTVDCCPAVETIALEVFLKDSK